MFLIMTVESSWKGPDTFQKWCDCIVPASNMNTLPIPMCLNRSLIISEKKQKQKTFMNQIPNKRPSGKTKIHVTLC